MDHLSELPDALIILILSLLPISDVVKTMILSKRWVHLWKTVPCLDFAACYPLGCRRNLFKYEDFVKGALAHWKGSKIQKFSLTFDVDVGSVAMFDSYLLFAVEKQVEELHVCYDWGLINYCPPQGLYTCSSITKMSISDCELRIDVAVQWNGLKSLTIVDSRRLSEDAIHRILAGAPLLEELILKVVYFNENLNLQSTSLKKLKFGCYCATLYVEVLNIWAPNLLDLEISGCFYGTCLLDVPSLTNAQISFEDTYESEVYEKTPPVEMFNRVFQSIRHVEKLILSDYSIKTLLRMKHNGFLIEFSNVKSLYLYPGEAGEMLGVLDMFPNLTKLWVHPDQDLYFLLEEGGIDSDLAKEALPSPCLLCLKRVEITWYTLDASIIRVIEILLQNAHLLEKLVFQSLHDRELWVMVEEKVLRLPRSSPTAELIVIKDCSGISSPPVVIRNFEPSTYRLKRKHLIN